MTNILIQAISVLCVFIMAITWQVVSYKWNLGSYSLSVFLACKVGLLELFKPCTQATTMWMHSGYFSVCVIRYHDQENLKKKEFIWFIYSLPGDESIVVRLQQPAGMVAGAGSGELTHLTAGWSRESKLEVGWDYMHSKPPPVTYCLQQGDAS